MGQAACAFGNQLLPEGWFCWALPSSHSLPVLATGQAAWGTVVFRAAGRLTNVSGQAERTMGVLNYHRPGHVVFCIGLVRRARLLLSLSFAEVPGQAAESLANARPITGGRTPSCARGQAAMDNSRRCRGYKLYLAGCFHPVPATSCRVAGVWGTRSARPTECGSPAEPGSLSRVGCSRSLSQSHET